MQELRDLASFLNVHSVNLLHSGNLSVKLTVTAGFTTCMLIRPLNTGTGHAKERGISRPTTVIS